MEKSALTSKYSHSLVTNKDNGVKKRARARERNVENREREE